jgi:hypothetical protein
MLLSRKQLEHFFLFSKYSLEGESKGGGRGKEGEMTQTLYAHMNKIKIKKICIKFGDIPVLPLA